MPVCSGWRVGVTVSSGLAVEPFRRAPPSLIWTALWTGTVTCEAMETTTLPATVRGTISTSSWPDPREMTPYNSQCVMLNFPGCGGDWSHVMGWCVRLKQCGVTCGIVVWSNIQPCCRFGLLFLKHYSSRLIDCHSTWWSITWRYPPHIVTELRRVIIEVIMRNDGCECDSLTCLSTTCTYFWHPLSRWVECCCGNNWTQ